MAISSVPCYSRLNDERMLHGRVVWHRTGVHVSSMRYPPEPFFPKSIFKSQPDSQLVKCNVFAFLTQECPDANCSIFGNQWVFFPAKYRLFKRQPSFRQIAILFGLMLCVCDRYGFIVMDGNGSLFGALCGNSREVITKFTVDLPKKHGRGGQSALRFARLRLEKRHNYVRKVTFLLITECDFYLASQFFLYVAV